MADGLLTDRARPGHAIDAPRPVAAHERVEAMDALRGFALLGILVPNIVFFAWPQAAQTGAEVMNEMVLAADPAAVVHRRANRIGYLVTETAFTGKFMFLFATLFGAGVYFFDRKFDRPATGPRVPLARGAGLWHARTAWLLLIGLAHAFGLWYGDILVWYAAVGLTAMWWVRRLPPAALYTLAAFSYLAGTAVMLAVLGFSDMAIAGGHIPADQVTGPDPAAEFRVYAEGSYLSQVLQRAGTLIPWYLLFPFTFFWQIVGLMCLGLALTKAGVYTGQRSARFYAGMTIAGLGVGAALTWGGHHLTHRINSPLESMYWLTLAQLLGAPIALGYAGAILLAVRAGALRPLLVALGAVGRMALSNYLLQTILCTAVFYSHGLGWFGSVQYPALWGVVAAVWCVNILFSLAWLRFFRFGPAEWAWRSLTYLRPQPMRRPQSAPPAAPA